MEESKNENINFISKNKKDILFENIITIPEKCKRCKLYQPEIMCKNCYPFIYFCLNCSDSIHSMPSKKNHNLISLNELNQDLLNENKAIQQNSNNMIDSLNNLNISKNTKDYVNDIKSLYELEKINFMKTNTFLEKNIKNIKDNYDKKIFELTEKLSKVEKNKNDEIKVLEETMIYKFKNILEQKEQKINFLLQKNAELNKLNDELMLDLSNKEKEINSKNILINKQNNDIERINNEKKDLMEENKKKIDKINKIYNEEKKEMINKYEMQINKLNVDYMTNKDRMKFLLIQREKEIEDMKNKYENYINFLTKEKKNDKYNNNKNININKIQ